MSKFKVLLIEDVLAERMRVMNVLRGFDVEIESAVTFERARDLVAKRKYDLIISELLLSNCPEFQGDGIQFWHFVQNVHPDHGLLLVADDSMRNTIELFLKDQELPAMISKPVCHIALTEILHDRLQWVKKLAA